VYRLLLVLLTVFGLAGGSSAQEAPPAAPTQSTEPASIAHSRRLLEQGQFDRAIAELQTLAASKPPPPGLAREFGVAFYKKGDYIKAIEQFKQALAQNADDQESTQLLGLSYYLAGKPSEAIPYLEKVQTWFPRANVDATYILGIAYIQTKDYDRARGAFARMFDFAPDSAFAYLVTARMLLRQEFVPIAEQYAHKAIEIDPKLPLAHFLLGELYLFKSQMPEAISELEKELALNPAYAPAYYKLADAYSRTQKYDDAERFLQRSIWLDSTNTGPFVLMGKVLAKKGEYELAVRALQRAAAMDPNNPMTHQLLGQTYRDLGRNEEAEKELQTASRLRQSQDAQ
jgi:tetratricopeptide (TPR) repeat protein